MTPSVGGTRKVRVATLLTLAAGSSGALAGLVAGLLWAFTGLPAVGPRQVVALLALTAVADLLYWWRGVPRPLAVGRQVPVLWSRLFGPETVAVLYGARLGVGPLTILTTWSWWTATAVAASTGIWRSLAVGGLFGVTRVVLIVLTAEWARRSMAHRMGKIARRHVAISALLVMAYVVLLPISASVR